MEWGNSMVGRSRSDENYEISSHVKKLYGFQDLKSIGTSEGVDEFSEEDVWGIVNTEDKHVGFQESADRSNALSRMSGKEGNSYTTRRMKIQRAGNHHDEDHGARMRYQSAPVNIPDWSQILKSESRRRINEAGYNDRSDDGDSDGDDYEERIPPHELIAKQLARSQMTSFSVYEGAGRTLKGRDLSRVRNAVWTRTGFLG